MLLPNVVQLTFNSEPAIPVIFIAEGFKTSQMQDFRDLIDDAIDGLESFAPFSSNTTKFNYYKMETTSVEDGISVLTHSDNVINPEIIKNTYWDVYRNYIGMDWYTHLPDSKRRTLYNFLTDEDNSIHFADHAGFYPVFICNEDTKSGSAEFKGLKPKLITADHMSVTVICVPTANNDFKRLFVHEFAHAFGDLDDEYVDSYTATQIEDHQNDLWIYANRLNVKDTNPGGWYEGARYVSSGKWRSSLDCLMQSVWYPATIGFSSGNQDLIQDRIDDET